MTVETTAARAQPTHPAAAPSRRTRVDIQALRAIAVILVVLNHFWPSLVPGGFTGVDIFFVISGFLITAHLRRELDATGRVRLAAFWSRRVKRLLPAAMLVLLVTLVAALIWMPVTAWQKTMVQIAGAGVYVLNWILAADSVNYFAAGTVGTPVTHYWSLSVEEQFYIVWPLLILAAMLFCKGKSAQARNVVLLTVFAAVVVASFAFATFTSWSEPTPAYFYTTGRAWEFALGGLLTFIPRVRSSAWRVGVSWVAWMSFAAAALLLNGSSGVPGPAALLPVFATAIIIVIGDSDARWAPTRVTSIRPVQFVGDVSYSIYLWHWPLIFLLPFIIQRPVNTVGRIAALVAVVVLAWLTKKYVEDPPRRSSAAALKRPAFTLGAAAVSMVLLVALTVPAYTTVDSRAAAASDRFEAILADAGSCFGAQSQLSGAECLDSHRLSDPDLVLADAVHSRMQIPNGTSCLSAQGDPKVTPCTFGAEEGSERLSVALVGDSHADTWVDPLAAIAESSEIRITTYMQSGCPVSSDDSLQYAPATSPTVIAGCRTWRNQVVDDVTNDPSIDVVITTSKHKSFVHGAGGPVDDGSGYAEAWARWVAAGKRVVVINDVPDRVVDVPLCIAQNADSADPCTAPASPLTSPGPLEKAYESFDDPRITFVDFTDAFCDEKICHSVIGGIPAYIDPSHLTRSFARSFAPEFAEIEALNAP
ncbi:hypothetical protein NS234_12300 [Microbacterium oxydans]|uniref:acyltransferase family protein n=1 Tax=Microbacterium oxydans TaxID=82380 RepID=UPI0007344C44|nr:acyltransferase family protein [Microbacterium oxydans]KTR76200.1 hypothetical protein NS234_12300 [Microbacterium oxydans]